MAEGKHPFPSRTRQLSPPAPMILAGQLVGKVGRRLVNIEEPSSLSEEGFLLAHHLTRPPSQMQEISSHSIPASRYREDRESLRAFTTFPSAHLSGSLCFANSSNFAPG